MAAISALDTDRASTPSTTRFIALSSREILLECNGIRQGCALHPPKPGQQQQLEQQQQQKQAFGGMAGWVRLRGTP
ncbi:hypothetical protein C405_00582 [Stenotrophomonas maltophilia AU12-09]|nr:hypothetical protein C405_00582 [Stenotrophomonas maltophilia AU12-09]